MKKVIESAWEGRHFDLWALVHFCSGATFGAAALFFALSFQASFLILIIAAILWEMLEIYKEIKEFRLNRALDVLAAGIGFGLLYFFLPLLNLPRLYLPVFLALVCLLAVLNYLGWRNYKRRTKKRDKL